MAWSAHPQFTGPRGRNILRLSWQLLPIIAYTEETVYYYARLRYKDG
jgi:hypothetical protein